MKFKGNKTIYYIALVAYAALLWFACIMLAVLLGLDGNQRSVLYALFIAFVMLFLWSKKYLKKWLEITDNNTNKQSHDMD